MAEKFSKRVENTVGKGEVARYQQFLLVTSNFSFSHSVFKRLVLQTCKNQGLFGKGLIQIMLNCSVNMLSYIKERSKSFSLKLSV